MTDYTPVSDDGISTAIPTGIDAVFTNSNSSEQTVAYTIESIPESTTLGGQAVPHLRMPAAACRRAAALASCIHFVCTSCLNALAHSWCLAKELLTATPDTGALCVA